MENLKKFLQSKENQILTNLKTGEPNEQQLNNFTLNFTNQLEQLTLQAPSEVKRICQNGIVSIGWDSKRRQRIPTSTMTSSTVLSGIRQIQTDLENLNPPIEPSANELADISIAANRLWDLDVNRLIPQTDYIINVQGGKKIYNEGDAASEPFFTYVDASVFERPTYRAFRQLLDNYVAETGVAENVTTEERRENQTFLNLIADTPVMKYCHRYLVLKGYAPADKNEFINLLNDLWFGLYKREVQNDSSGFEHVFLGEIKDGEVTGLHNWIQLYDEEKSHRLDYLGYILPKRNPSVGGYRVSAQDQQLVTIQFTWKGFLKKCSSSFIGTSPEFEIALYTICFLQQQEKYLVNCGPYRVEITCYKYTSRGKNYIGTCFPTDAPLDENEAASKIQSSYRGQSARKTK